ncbi:hypothetical protein SISSUDRAFT_1068022 [Sistotremastrum suecicum HHB10207 ss-3]|uniref:Uncharacterized protein n=1 Tax=Sistotremastrum suecicum HHB10207 ss-3 TaxID=1314776 RepID=A0A165WHN6_9AGAM|nr:hypothetical protein SISSUDRAFT_1068022 [Sistotremastrum suecicum HHB10207 ss-3]
MSTDLNDVAHPHLIDQSQSQSETIINEPIRGKPYGIRLELLRAGVTVGKQSLHNFFIGDYVVIDESGVSMIRKEVILQLLYNDARNPSTYMENKLVDFFNGLQGDQGARQSHPHWNWTDITVHTSRVFGTEEFWMDETNGHVVLGRLSQIQPSLDARIDDPSDPSIIHLSCQSCVPMESWNSLSDDQGTGRLNMSKILETSRGHPPERFFCVFFDMAEVDTNAMPFPSLLSPSGDVPEEDQFEARMRPP